MIFKGEPNMFVKISNKYVQRATSKKGFYFDNNSEYETDNETLTKVLVQHFKVKEEIKEEITIEAPAVELKKKHCKKCSFECDNQGELLAHYRNEHPKEGE